MLRAVRALRLVRLLWGGQPSPGFANGTRTTLRPVRVAPSDRSWAMRARCLGSGTRARSWSRLHEEASGGTPAALSRRRSRRTPRRFRRAGAIAPDARPRTLPQGEQPLLGCGRAIRAVGRQLQRERVALPISPFHGYVQVSRSGSRGRTSLSCLNTGQYPEQHPLLRRSQYRTIVLIWSIGRGRSTGCAGEYA